MSHFYGVVKGSRGPATRTATKSGLTVTAASWDGCIKVHLSYNEETGKNEFYILQDQWRGSGACKEIASGVIGE